LKVNPIGTAKKGATLKVLGELPRALWMHFTSVPQVPPIRVRPAVVEGLAMECNISGPFLKGHQIDHLHTKDSLRIKGTLIPLMASLALGGPKRHVYAASPCIVEPWSVASVPLRINGIGDAAAPPIPENIDTCHLEQWGVEMAGLEGNVATVYNPTRTTRLIRGQSRIGTVGGGATNESPGDSPGPEEKVSLEQELRDVLKHKDSALTNAKELDDAHKLLLDYIDVFSHDGEFGHTNLVKHRIHTGEITPVKCRNRPINPAMVEDLRNQVNEWLRHGVIEPSMSPWASALVASKKKNGKTRWCVDYRVLNEATTKDAYPMPLIEENLAQLSKSRIFSSVDGSGAFHVVDLEEDAKPKTAFATPWGLYQFKRMPFGLCNAPATYSRLMRIVLQHIPADQALSYLDDTLVHSPDLQRHHEYLRNVLEAHRAAGLKLQPSKCHFFLKEVEYLGHMVSEKGIRIMPGYTDVVRKWPLPRTLTEVRAFLGKVGYYRRFIKDFGAIARPLTEATKEENLDGKNVRMTKEIETAHRKLRQALCEAPILAYPQFDGEPFIVDTDWSCDNRAIGGVLSQVQGGLERVICYGAKKLSSSQANYSATKGELFAIIYFLRHWRYYLQYRRFKLRTDHRALTWIKTMEAPTGMVSRWLDTLANFDFEVVYRKGTQHGNADGLSRAPHAEPMEEEAPDEVIGAIGESPRTEEMEVDDDIEEIDTSTMEEVLMSGTDSPYTIPRTMEQWASEQLRDRDFREVIALLRSREIPTAKERRHLPPRVRHLLDLLPLIYLDPRSGALRLYREDRQSGVPVVPIHLEEPLTRLAHELAGHRGVQATAHMLHLQAYVLSGSALARQVVETCWPCQVKSGELKPQRHTHRTVVSGFPFQRISIDFVGPLRTTATGYTCILTIKDTFSKWVEAFPLRAARAEEAAGILVGEIFSRYGFPDEIHSDRGTQFTGRVMKQLGELIGYSITWTPSYHPQSNPVERAHRDLKAGIRAALETVGGQEWDQCLPQVLFAFRCTPARGTGLTPFEVLFGRQPNIPIGAIDPAPSSGKPLAEYVAKLRGRILDVHHWARENLAKEVARQQRAYQAVQRQFEVGDRVWRYNPVPQKGGKFARSWTGPWEVAEKLSPVLYKLRDDQGDVTTDVVPIDRLKRYYPAPNRHDYLPSRQRYSPPVPLALTLLPRPSTVALPDEDVFTDSGSESSSDEESEDEGGPPAHAPAVAHQPPAFQLQDIQGHDPGQLDQFHPPQYVNGRRPAGTPAIGRRPAATDPARGTDGRQAAYARVHFHGPDIAGGFGGADHRAGGDAGWGTSSPAGAASPQLSWDTPRWPLNRSRRPGEPTPGHTPYWQDRHHAPWDSSRYADSAEGVQGYGWKHRPKDYFVDDDSSPESSPGAGRAPRQRAGAHARANLPDAGGAVEQRYRQPHELGAEQPGAADRGAPKLAPRRGRPPLLSRQHGARLHGAKRGRPRVADRTVSFTIPRRTGRVEKPYTRSEAARQRQSMRALTHVLAEEEQRRKQSQGGRSLAPRRRSSP
jgi:hypothetical protein